MVHTRQNRNARCLCETSLIWAPLARMRQVPRRPQVAHFSTSKGIGDHMKALKLVASQETCTRSDESDAKRLIECVAVVTMMPALMSSAARSKAAAELRRLGLEHTRFSDLYSDIISHIESYNPA